MDTAKKPGINFAASFGATAKPAAQGDKPKAEYWLNVGYLTNVKDADTGENRFVSLAMGIPLDTQEHLDTNKGTQEFRAFQAARNQLQKDIMASVLEKGLKHNESFVIPLENSGGLAVQIRRVKEDVPFDETAENPFLKRANV